MFAADRALLLWINHWPASLSKFFIFLSEATKDNFVRAILALVSIGLIYHKPTRKATILALVSWPLANGSTDLFKKIPFHRPTHDNLDVIPWIGKLSVNGTASAHAANMAAIAFVFTYFFGWRGGLAWIVVAFLVGLSRIYVGVHYPTQVLLGWTCGCVVSLVVIKTWEAIERTRKGPTIVSKDVDETVKAD